MKALLFLLVISTSLLVSAQTGNAKTVKTKFSRTTTVSTEIKATPSAVWHLLTDAANFAKWNSTIVSLTGNITLKEKIVLVSTIDPKRAFKLKVKVFEVNKTLVWGDGKGNRTFTITEQSNGNVLLTMTETISGLMYPMYAKYIPSFDASFNQFVADLKQTAEQTQNK